MDYRVPFRRVLRYRRNCCRLDQCKIRRLLSEVSVGCGTDSVARLREIYIIEIHLKYLCLIVSLFKVKRLKDLLCFTLDRNVIVTGNILDKLLSDCRSALRATAEEVIKRDLYSSDPVDTVVALKTLVLNSNKCLRKVIAHIGIRDPGTVLCGTELLIFDDVAVCVYVADRSCKTALLSHDRKVVNARIKMILYVKQESTADYNAGYNSDKTDSYKYTERPAKALKKRLAENAYAFCELIVPIYLLFIFIHSMKLVPFKTTTLILNPTFEHSMNYIKIHKAIL